MSQDMERDGCRSASVDDRLRRVLDPDPGTVRRVVRSALDATADLEAGSRFPWKSWAAATALVAVLVAALAVWESGRSREVAPSVPLITNASGELVLVLPDETDEPAIVSAGRADETPIIFNYSRVVAANVPGLEPRFVISGGGS